MSTKNAALLVVSATLLVAGCVAAPGATDSSTVAPPAPTATATALVTPVTTQTPAPTPTIAPATPTIAPATAAPSPCRDVGSDAFVTVSGRANIFGAGHDVAPAPGEGGAGLLPPQVEVEISEGAQVTFPCTSGTVDCCTGSEYSSPAGPAGSGWHTDIDSFGGISGIIHAERGVFLVGVFIGDEEPADPAPERLDFTETCPEACTFTTLEPELGQIFYIGDGGEQITYVAPAGATRLFLGIADALFVQGAPGWYGNNSGEYQAAVTIL